jgi:hypothetical protein
MKMMRVVIHLKCGACITGGAIPAEEMDAMYSEWEASMSMGYDKLYYFSMYDGQGAVLAVRLAEAVAIAVYDEFHLKDKSDGSEPL